MIKSIHASTITRLTLAALSFASSIAFASDVNVGVTISGELQPGVYGQVNIGTMPNYSLVYPQPTVIVAQPRYAVPVQPLYLHVPPGHARKWDKHCHQYNACSRPVYFLRSAEYEPAYHEHQSGGGHHEKHGKSKGKGNKGHKH